MPETIPPSANFGIAANAPITPAVIVAINAGSVKGAAGPVPNAPCVAPVIAFATAFARSIEISCPIIPSICPRNP